MSLRSHFLMRYAMSACVVVASVSSVLPSAVAATTTSDTSIFAGEQSPDRGSHRYIIRFADNVSDADKDQEISDHQGIQQHRLNTVFNGVIADLTPTQAVALHQSPNVLWIEEDKSVFNQTVVSPPGSWGLDRIDETSLPLDNRYEYTTDGTGVTAYVIDSGILKTHNQFIGRVSDSYFDAFGGDATDCNGHGTFVSGIVAGSTLGVAPKATIVPVRAFDCTGSGSVSGVIAGIDWAINHHTTEPAVMNLSLGASKSDSLNSAVDRAFADGITVVAAAGNTNVDACTMSPGSNTASALTVGATTNTDARASYSNYGSCLDLFAPGSGITSAWYTGNTATNVMSGTSAASPHVAGLVARYLSSVPTASPSSAMAAIVSTATSNVVVNAGPASPNKLAFASSVGVPSMDGATNPDSNARTPDSSTVATPTTSSEAIGELAPHAPTRIVVARKGKNVMVLWTPPDNAMALSHEVLFYRNRKIVAKVLTSSSSGIRVYGLKSGTYAVRVRAITTAGISALSQHKVLRVK